MNIDAMLETLHRHQVRYILIGGVNFLLKHKPVLTFDLDIWIQDSPQNLEKALCALIEMEAEWGESTEKWSRVSNDPKWLLKQPVFCLLTKFGALDLFREVKGLEGRFEECFTQAHSHASTPAGTPFIGLSDRHMLECQLALKESDQKKDRIAELQKAIRLIP
jgi:hypothetical protein